MRVITQVAIVRGYVVDVTFDDGSRRQTDLRPYLWGEVFAPVLADYEMFRQVRVDDELGTLVWPNGADLDPDVLHGDEVPAGRLPAS